MWTGHSFPMTSTSSSSVLEFPENKTVNVIEYHPLKMNGYEMGTLDSHTISKVALKCFEEEVPVTLFGSRRVRGIMGRDWDFMIPVFKAQDPEKFEKELLKVDNFFDGLSGPADKKFAGKFKSLRNAGLINLVLFYDKDLYDSYKKATDFIKDTQLKLKSERVAVYEYLSRAEDRISDEDFIALALGKPYSKDLTKKYGAYDNINEDHKLAPF